LGTLSKIFYKVKLKILKTKIILLTTKITAITVVVENISRFSFLILFMKTDKLGESL